MGNLEGVKRQTSRAAYNGPKQQWLTDRQFETMILIAPNTIYKGKPCGKEPRKNCATDIMEINRQRRRRILTAKIIGHLLREIIS